MTAQPLARQTPIAKWLAALAAELPQALHKIAAEHPWLLMILRVAALLATYLLVDSFVRRAASLSPEHYAQANLSVALLQRLGWGWTTGLALAGAALARYGGLLCRWDELAPGRATRYFVVFLALLLVWPMSTLGYNYFYDQAYAIDRLLLCLLLVALWFRPVFIYPLALMLMAMMWQIREPLLGGTVLAHKFQVLHVLNLFGGALLAHAVSGRRRLDDFFFLCCCFAGAAYWEPALAKLEIGWLSYGHLYRMPLAAHAHGWLSFVDAATIVSFAQAISWLDLPMGIFVLAAEGGCLLLMWRRGVSIGLLSAVIVFHFGVFALYGFLFWTWILLDVALLAILIRDDRTQGLQIYTRPHLVLSIVLIGSAGLWYKPPHLGWFDTRLSYTYRLDAIGDSGRRYSLPPRFFEPYGDVFTMASFGYLVPDRGVLVGPYGVTLDRAIADGLNAARTADEVFTLEQRLAPERHKPERSQRFYEFVTTYAANRNARGAQATWTRYLEPPRQFWSQPRGQPYRDQEPIRQVAVREVTTLYDDQRLYPIRDHELATLDIPRRSATVRSAR